MAGLSARDTRIDFFKGILMWCVVYGHTVDAFLCGTRHSPVWLHVFVRTFDLPFFMVLSGYFLKRSLGKRSALVVALNRISMIFAPIATWTLLRGHPNVFCGTYYFLWAVLVSGMICIAGHVATSWLPGKAGTCLEMALYAGAATLLHFVNIPWNLFYLFPFFVVGYFMDSVRFDLSRKAYFIVFVAMVTGLCFWSPGYTPWRMGALAWRGNPTAIGIFVYRFVLAIAGVFVMATVFEVARSLMGEGSFFARIVTDAGRETLAIYILQTIFVERLVRRMCGVMWARLSGAPSQPVVNLVGYVLAPMASFLFVVGLNGVIRHMRRIPVLRHSFGFKVA